MGVYRRAERLAHGYPVYQLVKDGKTTHFLYRASDDKCWTGTDSEGGIAMNRGAITMKEPGDLPTCDGVWQYLDRGSWQDDSAMACTEVRGDLGSAHAPHAHDRHSPQRLSRHDCPLPSPPRAPTRPGRGGPAHARPGGGGEGGGDLRACA